MTINLRNSLFGLVATFMVGSLTGASAEDLSAASKAVWDGHLQKVMSKDLNAVMADFTDQSAIITTDHIYVGKPEVRAFIGKFIEALTPEAMKSIVMQAEEAHDNIVCTKFTVGVAKRTFLYTAQIKDGKIMTVTTANYAAE
jgi:hypothetical protein